MRRMVGRMKEKKSNTFGCFWFLLIILAVVIFGVLFALRITGMIVISWWWVFSPLILAFTMPLVILLIATLIVIIGGGEDG